MTRGSSKTQGTVWHQLFKLLDTTNMLAQAEKRKGLARADDVVRLRASCIETKQERKHDWKTRKMSVERLLELVLEECVVGAAGVSLKDCLIGIQACLSRAEVPSAVCQLYKIGNDAEFTIFEVIGKRDAVLNDMRQDVGLNRAETDIQPVGYSTISIKWRIPLRKKVGGE